MILIMRRSKKFYNSFKEVTEVTDQEAATVAIDFMASLRVSLAIVSHSKICSTVENS